MVTIAADGGSSRLVSYKFYPAKMAWVWGKKIKTGAEGGSNWYRVCCPLCLFFFSDLFFFNIRLPCVYAFKSLFIVQESHRV